MQGENLDTVTHTLQSSCGKNVSARPSLPVRLEPLLIRR